MPIIDLNLPISKSKFVRWLQHYVKSTRDESIPTSHGSITISNLTISGMDDLLTSAAIDGILSISDDELAGMSLGSRRLSDLYGNKRNARGLVAFRFRQDRQLNVIVSHDDPALSSYFDVLVAAIHDRWLKKAQEQDVTHHVPQPAPADNSGQNKGGRPRNLDDDWAWVEVWERGRKPDDVYLEWRVRIGDRLKTLSDARDSFNKAISRRRGRGINRSEME